MHAKATGEFISFGFSDRSVPSLVSEKRSANRRVQTKNDFTFWMVFGLSPNLGLISESLSDRLIQKVKNPLCLQTVYLVVGPNSQSITIKLARAGARLISTIAKFLVIYQHGTSDMNVDNRYLFTIKSSF